MSGRKWFVLLTKEIKTTGALVGLKYMKLHFFWYYFNYPFSLSLPIFITGFDKNHKARIKAIEERIAAFTKLKPK